MSDAAGAHAGWLHRGTAVIPRVRRVWFLVSLAVVAAQACTPASSEEAARLDVASALATGDTDGYARALEPMPFAFPDDHGPHPDFRTEWWYVTANLRAEDGREFGTQFTIFRSALAPDEPTGASPWRTRQAYMGHFALSDISNARFRSFERFGRGAVGIAGAQVSPFRVWLDDWELASVNPEAEGHNTIFPIRLKASEDEAGVDLELGRGRGLVLQGDSGLSSKGGEGNASYYYSLPRMQARGTVRIGDRAVEVTGTAWLDREWSTSLLRDDQVGWDWFALHLPDGRDLMYFELRSNAQEPWTDGLVLDEGSTRHRISPGMASLEVLDRWSTPDGAGAYPSAWRLVVPSLDVDVTVRSLLADQELRHSFRYWEGAVSVTDADGRVSRGYVELTGYVGSSLRK
jgi:predicted secreted hydrolase